MNFHSEWNEISKARRNSGRLIVYYRKTIGKGVNKLKSTSSDIIWSCVPLISPFNRDINADEMFDELRNEIDYYATQDYRIGLDLNSNAADIAKLEYVQPLNITNSHVNPYGRQLMKLLTNYGMLIANGRVCGDMYGSYTSYSSYSQHK